MKLSFKNILSILLIFTLLILFAGCFLTPSTHTLTMAVNPTGGGTTNPAVGANPGYAANQVVSISATPVTGYHFVNWTGDDVANSNLASTTVTMDANKTVTANFELNAAIYTLTMAVNPTGGGITNPAVGVHPGYTDNQVVNISLPHVMGYNFFTWCELLAILVILPKVTLI